MKLGGLVYVTNTDGRGSAGKAPAKALAAYGTWATHHSAVNEQGLRMLVSCCLEWSEGRSGVKEWSERVIVQSSRQSLRHSLHHRMDSNELTIEFQ